MTRNTRFTRLQFTLLALLFSEFCLTANTPLPTAAPELPPAYKLNEAMAVNLSELALNCIHQPYPYKPGHVLFDAEDAVPHTEYHPVFYGCFDWHSAVHGHWTLVKLLKTFPEMENATLIRQKLIQSFTTEGMEKELAYFQTEGRTSFERMYGWAWYLKLAEELLTWEDDEQAQQWYQTLKPLADHLVQSYKDFLPKQTYAIRRGVHPNTAFGLAFAYDYAIAAGDAEFVGLIRERAQFYYQDDTNYSANYELGGDNFFSQSLMEADLMRRILEPAAFSKWFAGFLPGIANGKPQSILTPATVSDRTDGYIVHLDGLNLSRAWCMAGIIQSLAESDPRRKVLHESAIIHACSALPELSSGHYEGDHWLGSFAVYMLSELESITE